MFSRIKRISTKPKIKSGQKNKIKTLNETVEILREKKNNRKNTDSSVKKMIDFMADPVPSSPLAIIVSFRLQALNIYAICIFLA